MSVTIHSLLALWAALNPSRASGEGQTVTGKGRLRLPPIRRRNRSFAVLVRSSPIAFNGAPTTVRYDPRLSSGSEQRLYEHGETAAWITGEPVVQVRPEGLIDRWCGAVQGVDDPEVLGPADRPETECVAV